jgi:hypothetical protein
MLTFLFWNLKSDNIYVLAGLVKEHNVDVLILAECLIAPGLILAALNPTTAEYYYAQTDCAKLQLYTRFSDEYVLPVQKEDGSAMKGDDFTIRRLSLRDRPEVLLCGVHFPSKLYQTPADQTHYATRFANLLAEAEDAAGHTRTVLVGDLNMNPYEDGVVFASGLHAVMTRRIANKLTRRVKFESNLYFYNPMWAHFGEKVEGHAGTYYYSSPKTRADFWNIYDQVLIRPALLPYFRDDDVQIICRCLADDVPLVTPEGIPHISDHLPVLFRLHI